MLLHLMSLCWKLDQLFGIPNETVEGEIPNPFVYFGWTDRAKAWTEEDDETIRLIMCLGKEATKEWNPRNRPEPISTDDSRRAAKRAFLTNKSKLQGDLNNREHMEITRYNSFIQLSGQINLAFRRASYTWRWTEGTKREEAIERYFFRALDAAIRLDSCLSRRFSRFEELFNSIREKVVTSEDVRYQYNAWAAVRLHREAPSWATFPILDEDGQNEAAAASEDSEEEDDATSEQGQEERQEDDQGEAHEEACEEVQVDSGLPIPNARAVNGWQTSVATGRNEQDSHIYRELFP